MDHLIVSFLSLTTHLWSKLFLLAFLNLLIIFFAWISEKQLREREREREREGEGGRERGREKEFPSEIDGLEPVEGVLVFLLLSNDLQRFVIRSVCILQSK